MLILLQIAKCHILIGKILSTNLFFFPLTTTPPTRSPKLKTAGISCFFSFLIPISSKLLEYLLYHLRKIASVSALAILNSLPSSSLTWQEFPKFPRNRQILLQNKPQLNFPVQSIIRSPLLKEKTLKYYINIVPVKSPVLLT